MVRFDSGRKVSAPAETVAIVCGEIASGDARALDQAVEAHVKDRADRLVDVEGETARFVAAKLRLCRVKVIVLSLFGDDVDSAAGSPAASIARSRSAQNLDFFRKEILANADTRVADAVNENVVAGVNPRMKNRSPKALPPSPEPRVTPAVVRPISRSDVAFSSCSTCCVRTVTERGVLKIGSLNLLEEKRSA